MVNRIPPRLRAPVTILMSAVVCVAVAVSVYGWVSVLYLGPFALVAATGYYVLAGRGTDMAAMLRRRLPGYRAVWIQSR